LIIELISHLSISLPARNWKQAIGKSR